MSSTSFTTRSFSRLMTVHREYARTRATSVVQLYCVFPGKCWDVDARMPESYWKGGSTDCIWCTAEAFWICGSCADSSNNHGGFARDIISWSNIVHESSAVGAGNANATLVSGGVCMACMLDSSRWNRTVWILAADWFLRSRLWRCAWMRCKSGIKH